MTLRPGLAASLALAAALASAPPLAARAQAQEPEAEPGAAAEAAPAKPKPRPKPKPRSAKPGAEAKPGTVAEPGTVAGSGAPPLRGGASDAETRPVPIPEPPQLRVGPAPPDPVGPETASQSPAPSPAPPPSPSQGAFAAPAVACDPGQSVLYDGPDAFALWVTRTGTVTIDNPLRPLTPDVTRVLQLVIAGKLATAYGSDLAALRRGPAPGALEGALGGPIRWDAALGTLPDLLNIVADSGRTLAELRFRECGTAPAAKALPAPVAKRREEKRREEKPRPVRRAPAADEAGAQPPSRPPTPGAAPIPAEGAAPPRRLNLPQGALPE